jgi:tetratricopeptide (TPR) repeat protein
MGATFQLRGELHFLEGNVAGAQRDWSTALAIAERSLRPGHPDIALSLRYLANAAKAFGDLATARQLLDRALPMASNRSDPVIRNFRDYSTILRASLRIRVTTPKPRSCTQQR